jgi:nitrate/nitrite transport system substrate-binding protein
MLNFSTNKMTEHKNEFIFPPALGGGVIMSVADDPFDANKALNTGVCSCGSHNTQREHGGDHAADALHEDDLVRRPVENAVIRALFPSDLQRRAFLRLLAPTALPSPVFPLATAAELRRCGGSK